MLMNYAKIWWPIIGVLVVLSLISWLSPQAWAQGRPQPTPTKVATVQPGGDKESKPKNRNAGATSPDGMGTTVAGIVFNYTTSAPQGGIAVVLQGNDWQVETVSDVKGYYQFSNLGEGQATLDLRLPTGAVSVTPHWTVMLRRDHNQVVNLGYYIGKATLPVALEMMWQSESLVIQVKNQLNQTVTGGYLDIALPTGFEASPAIQATQGEIQYGIGRVRVSLGDVGAGGQVAVKIPLVTLRNGLKDQADIAKGRVMLTYDQQPTPLWVDLWPLTMTIAAPTAVASEFKPLLIPIAGYDFESRASAFKIFLAVALGLGLLIAGWRALRRRSA